VRTGDAKVLENDRAASLAAAILDFRRTRLEILPPDLFAEPAWDLLLELFLADAEGRRLTARQVCERSNIPPTVMARWLKHLSQNGYVVGDGSGDIDDLLVMSAGTLAKMEELMRRARQLQATGR
jgi:hypothetical protein